MLRRNVLRSVWRMRELSHSLPTTPFCPITPLSGLTARRTIHCGVVSLLDKDMVGKDYLIKSATLSREEFIDSSTVNVDGLTDAGIVIPTLETHASLVDGIRYDELPIVHIHASLNNTIITVTDFTGRKHIAKNSCGMEGFKNVKKSTTVAAQATGHTVGAAVLKKGIRNVRAVVKGLGVGRLSSLKGMQTAGLNIISITDRTHVPHDGPRPRKPRRL